MVWRTLVLSAVNFVTCMMVFMPIIIVTSPGHEQELFLHNGRAVYFFWIQAALGVFAVVIDLLSRKIKLQSKLITAGLALSIVLAGIVLWLSFSFDGIGCFDYDHEIGTGAWMPLLNVVLFGAMWIDQRRKMKNTD